MADSTGVFFSRGRKEVKKIGEISRGKQEVAKCIMSCQAVLIVILMARRDYNGSAQASSINKQGGR